MSVTTPFNRSDTGEVDWATVDANFDDLEGEINKTVNGSATIVAGDSTIVVAHGLASTPKVVVSPQDVNGVDYFVSTKTSTEFTINIQVPQAGDAVFDWIATIK